MVCPCPSAVGRRGPGDSLSSCRESPCRGLYTMRVRVSEYDEVPPNAPSLVNSMCASGYDLESAVADIIDNSISAKASSVRVIVNEDGASSWIAIADDGWGMDDATLRNAMTFGC